MAETDFESARQKYKPRVIKYLLIAEAPPKVESKRFFYFEHSQRGDSLFLEIMKVIYCHDSQPKNVRSQKPKFLERFKNDGFYLIDATDTPMKDFRPAKKREQIEKSLPSLRNKIRDVASDETKIILISSTVYDATACILKREGFNIINDCMIDFPGSGRQKKFRDKLSMLLEKHGWRGSHRAAKDEGHDKLPMIT